MTDLPAFDPLDDPETYSEVEVVGVSLTREQVSDMLVVGLRERGWTACVSRTDVWTEAIAVSVRGRPPSLLVEVSPNRGGSLDVYARQESVVSALLKMLGGR